MRNIALSRVLPFIIIPLVLWLGLRFIYYGSFTRGCIYTSRTVPVSSSLANSKLIFISSALIVSEPYSPYECVSSFKDIKKQIIPPNIGNRRDDGSQIDSQQLTNVNSESKIELSIVGVVNVTKHGLLTMASGRGPFQHLILKDQDGVIYQMPTVYLGINQGDEFLKLKKVDGSEEVLSADTVLADK